MKIYSILNDFAFQWIFNQPGREPILKSLLNAILHLQGADRIVEILDGRVSLDIVKWISLQHQISYL